MRQGWWLIVVALTWLSLSPTDSRGGPPVEKQYQIDFKVLQGDPLGSLEEGTLKIVAEPTIVTLEKQAASFQSGGVVKIDGDDVQTGLTGKFTPEGAAGGTIRLSACFNYTQILSEKENSLQLQTNQAHFVRTVKSGQVVRLQLSRPVEPRIWVELSVKEFVPSK
jgi:hypothetical protein